MDRDCNKINLWSGNLSRNFKTVNILKSIWIGSKLVVLKDVKIGEDSVMGSGSIIASNVDCHFLAGENPADVARVDIHRVPLTW